MSKERRFNLSGNRFNLNSEKETDIEELREKGRQKFANASDEERIDIKEKMGKFDYVNLPELQKLKKALENEVSIFSVHVSTTGIDPEKNAIICIDIVNTETNHGLRVPILITKEQYNLGVTDNFNCFEYTGIKYGEHAMSPEKAGNAIKQFIKDEMYAIGKEKYVVTGFQTEFIEKFLNKYGKTFDKIHPSIDTCVLCNELNGYEKNNGGEPKFPTKTNMKNVANELGQKNDTGLDRAYLSIHILDKVKEEYKQLLGLEKEIKSNLKGLVNEPNYLFVDDYIFAISEMAVKAKEQGLDIDLGRSEQTISDIGRNEPERDEPVRDIRNEPERNESVKDIPLPANSISKISSKEVDLNRAESGRELFSNIWGDKMDIVIADNVKKIGEAPIRHVDEYKKEKEAADLQSMSDFAKLLSVFENAVNKISDSIDRQTEEIEKSRQTMDKLTKTLEKTMTKTISYDATARENAEKNAGPIKQIIDDMKGHKSGSETIEYKETEEIEAEEPGR